MRSYDREASVQVCGTDSDQFPSSSCFASLADSSHFFECGSLGYSVTRDPLRLDGLRLKTKEWQVHAFAVEQVASTFFADTVRFPNGSAAFDHALIMRDIPHEWHQAADINASNFKPSPQKNGSG
jgi:hypothetical protein